MGFPPMLNGKHKKLNSSTTFTCPECGNEFNSFDVVNKIRSNQLDSTKNCPICKAEIPIKSLQKSLRNNET